MVWAARNYLDSNNPRVTKEKEEKLNKNHINMLSNLIGLNRWKTCIYDKLTICNVVGIELERCNTQTWCNATHSNMRVYGKFYGLMPRSHRVCKHYTTLCWGGD
jgi:hypothetical protein